MLAIHGIWADGALSLWAEDADRLATASGGVRPGVGRGGRTPRLHPFAAPVGLLADVLAGSGDVAADLARKAADSELTLWLPGTAGSPLVSPDLIACCGAAGPDPRSGQAARPVLAPWQVPALRFDPAAALAVLALVTQSAVIEPGVVEPGAISLPAAPAERGAAAGSMHYLAALGALAADLAARGRVLPGFEQAADGRYFARWRPVLAGPDALRARELTAAIPPVCRATSAVGEPSAGLVTGALDSLTDAAVRARLADGPGFSVLPPVAGGPLTDRWAAALTGEDGEVSVPAREAAMAAQLTFALWAWQDAAQQPPGPVRTCFRLTEPPRDSDGGSWLVELALQATDDPSLILPATDIWSGGTADGWAAAGISFPEDDLLAGLGRASRLFGELDGELQGAAPASVELDTAGALRFLKETGPLLVGRQTRRAAARLGTPLAARPQAHHQVQDLGQSRFGLRALVQPVRPGRLPVRAGRRRPDHRPG